MREEILMLRIWILSIINRKKVAVYLSGGITGVSPADLQAFEIAEKHYRRMGFFVVNPYKLFKDDVGKTWYYYMRLDIAIMSLIFKTEERSLFVSLPTWYDSRGAKAEREIAEALEIPIHNMSWAELNILRASESA